MTSVPGLNFPFFVHMLKAMQDEGKALGVKTVESDGQNSAPKQTADVEAAVVQGVNGIVISPIDVNAMAPALQTAVDNGVPVVTIDRRVAGCEGITAHVGADNVKGGEAQGEWVMATFPNGAKIINLQGQPGASPGDRPQQGPAQRPRRRTRTSTSSSPSRPRTSPATRACPSPRACSPA